MMVGLKKKLFYDNFLQKTIVKGGCVMSKWRSLLVGLLCFLFVGVGLVSAQPTENIGGKGQVLIFPVYAAFDGVSTDFKIVNTDSEHAVVAKVVFRTYHCSEELRDFLLYLSPNDVFTMSVEQFDGKVWVCTSDSSAPIFKAEYEAAEKPYEMVKRGNEICVEMDKVESCSDSDIVGYVTVYEATAFDGKACSLLEEEEDQKACSKDFASAPVSKTWIKKIYDGLGPDYAEITQDGFTVVDSLAGFADVNAEGWGTFKYRATALAGYYTNGKGAFIPEGKETSFCVLSQYGAAKVSDVEKALGKNNIAVPYVSGQTYVVLTFPTKLTTCKLVHQTGCSGCTSICTCQGVYNNCDNTTTGFFTNKDNFVSTDKTGCGIKYKATYYDLEEHSKVVKCGFSPCPEGEKSGKLSDEVNLLPVAGPFDAGWANLTIGGGEDYAPVVPLILEGTENGLRAAVPAYDTAEEQAAD